jgi:hypothetical protein
LAEAERATSGSQRTVPRDREENADIVPIHQRRAIRSSHDTILFRMSSNLSILDFYTYH